jgi:hypothetical protein
MEATAMNNLLQQLHDLVPAFNVASIPRDASGVFASPVHIIAGLLNNKLETIKKSLNKLGANINGNCTKMKVIADRIEQRNRIMVGNAESIMRVLASCNRPDMAAIVARLPAVAPVQQASVPLGTHNRPPPSGAPAPQAPTVAMDVDDASADDLQDNADMTIQDQFDFVPGQMVEFVLKLEDGSNFVVPVRRDGYVNVTKICQAACNGKFINDWKKLESSKEYMKFLQKTLNDEYAVNVKLGKVIGGIPPITLLTSSKGNSSDIIQGTFAHPDLAPLIAMWANKKFAIQVSRWVRELMITGRVELGKEKSGPELKQKLEETFQAVDEEEKAFLREKRSRKLLAIDENMVAKRAREEEDKNDRAAKRQRDDATAKEESRMQLVRFDAEMAAKAIAIEEEKEAKRQRDDSAFEEEMRVKKEKGALELASLKKKEELDYNNLLMPFVENIENRTNDAHVKALCKDIGMALLNQAKFLITGESSASQETRFCDDVTTIGRKLGFNKIFVEKHRVSLGRAVAAEFRLRNPLKEPQSTEKHVNSSYRSVFTYDVKDNEWIEDVVRQCLTKNMPAPVVPPSPKAPSRTIINYFTQ